MAQGIADVLSVEGYEVGTAPNGRAALVRMKAKTPDLVLSDIMMPEMDGHDFVRLVRANPEWRTLPFIFLTALGQRTDERRGLELGADHYLTKPFEPDDLLLAVRVRLQRAADHQAAAEAALADLRTSILTTLNHEFRTPLTYIVGYTRLLADEGRGMDDAIYQSCLNALLNGADRLKRLVENVLLVSQIETGEVAAVIKMFPQRVLDVRAEVEEVLQRFQAQADENGVELCSKVPQDFPSVSISKEYLDQILAHLIENGIKFSGDGGRVTIEASADQQYAEFIVKDNGIGIRSDALPWIFDSFRQVDRKKQEQQGAGLGLAIVRGLVQAHEGLVKIESEPNLGTTVRLQLPLV